MKKELNPAVGITIVVVVVVAIGYVLFTKAAGDSSKNLKDMPMPKAAAEEMAKMAKDVQKKKAQGGN